MNGDLNWVANLYGIRPKLAAKSNLDKAKITNQDMTLRDAAGQGFFEVHAARLRQQGKPAAIKGGLSGAKADRSGAVDFAFQH